MFVICISVSGMCVFGNVFIGTRERRIKDGGPLEVDGFQNAHWQKGHCHTRKCLGKQNRAKKPRNIQVHFVNSNMTKLKDIALKWVLDS